MAAVGLAVAALAVSASPAAAASYTTVTKSNAKLAFAAWQLNDAYNTSIQVGGNDLMFLGAGNGDQPGIPARP
jgi:hypothetical protein